MRADSSTKPLQGALFRKMRTLNMNIDPSSEYYSDPRSVLGDEHLDNPELSNPDLDEQRTSNPDLDEQRTALKPLDLRMNGQEPEEDVAMSSSSWRDMVVKGKGKRVGFSARDQEDHSWDLALSRKV